MAIAYPRRHEEDRAPPEWLKEVLTHEELQKMRDLRAARDWDAIKTMVAEALEELPEDRRRAIATFRQGSFRLCACCALGKIATPEEVNELKTLHGAGNEDGADALVNTIVSRLEGETKEKAEKMKSICHDLYHEGHSHDGHSHHRRSLDEALEKYLGWLTPEQKEELKELKAGGSSFDELKNKVLEFYEALEGDKKNEVSAKLKTSCTAWIKTVANDEEVAEIERLHESGDHESCKSKVAEYFERLPADKKEKVSKYRDICEKIWYGSHDHHDHGLRTRRQYDDENDENDDDEADEMDEDRRVRRYDNDENEKTDIADSDEDDSDGRVRRNQPKDKPDYKQFRMKIRSRKLKCLPHSAKKFTWLTEEQRAELRAMKDNGSDLKDLKAKVYEYFQALPEDRQTELKTSYKAKCVEWIKEVATEDEQNELKALLHANDKVAMKAKADALFEKLPEEKRAKLAHFRGICKRLWGVEVTGRLRRDSTAEPTHDHSDWRKYLDWLTPEQTAELKALKEGGADYSDLRDKLIEYYEALEGDIKEAAKETLKKGCVSWVKKVASEEEQAELKQLHSSNDQAALETKVQELVGRLDPKYQEKVEQVRGICKKLWGVESETASTETRRRRDGDNKQDYMQYMSWLSDDQKAEIASLKAAGASYSDMRDKVWEFYEALEGDAKTAAKEQLKGACGVFVKHIVKDQAKIDELKSLKDAGDKEAIKSKIDEIINAMEDGPQKERAQTVRADCQRLFEVAEARFKRGKGKKEGKSAKWMKFLTWMTNDQKNSLKALKDSGASPSQLVAEVKRSYES
uniref:Polyprotein allergen nematode domain-containing protein n=1 Tax=Plectus sambesii TaxID=2011161 RepID=A0A914V444_9BILA